MMPMTVLLMRSYLAVGWLYVSGLLCLYKGGGRFVITSHHSSGRTRKKTSMRLKAVFA